MNLDIIKKLTAKRDGGLKRLAMDINMSEQNLHRCIKKNNMQAADLEKISTLLNVDIRTFFDGSVGAENNVIETKGSYSPASIHGNISIDNEGGNTQERKYNAPCPLRRKRAPHQSIT